MGDAIGFIKVNYPDYYSTDELLQNGMKYGYYLAFLYKDYKGADNFITEQLQALEKLLKSTYGKYYGSQSGA